MGVGDEVAGPLRRYLGISVVGHLTQVREDVVGGLASDGSEHRDVAALGVRGVDDEPDEPGAHRWVDHGQALVGAVHQAPSH